MSTKTSAGKGSSDESIGRPKEWREGRYQQAGRRVDETVETTEADEPQTAIESTPVTREDYEELPPDTAKKR